MKPRSVAEALGRLVRRNSAKRPVASPASVEALLNLRMEHLEKQLDELKGRVNALVLVILAAVITDAVIRLLA